MQDPQMAFLNLTHSLSTSGAEESSADELRDSVGLNTFLCIVNIFLYIMLFCMKVSERVFSSKRFIVLFVRSRRSVDDIAATWVAPRHVRQMHECRGSFAPRATGL